MKQKASGISLIVLVITIIIIIILAGAVILSLNNSNIIAKAKLAKISNDMVQIREILEAEKAEVILNHGTFGSTNADNVNAKIPDNYKDDIVVSNEGGIFLKPGSNLDAASIGAVMNDLGAAVMPTGFKHSEGTVNEGIIIEDDTGTVTDGNQFVWIPVNNISEFIRVADFSAGTWTAIGSGYSAYNSGSTTETAEYNAMKASVTKYKGFYIARYEAGKTVASPAVDGTVKPVSKANIDVWNNIAWDAAYSGSGLGVDTNNGAVKVARAMYPVAGATAGGAVSTLTYGEQWDAAMRYMKDVANTTVSNSKYIINSIGMGEYTEWDESWENVLVQGQVEKTASSKAYEVKNIYDMAGNIYEWTMEGFNTVVRVVRGGSFGNGGTNYPASYRTDTGSYSGNIAVGFRVAIYIK